MEQLDAEHDELLDEDGKLVGHVKDREEVEKSLRHKLITRNSDNTSCQAPEVHTWYILVHTQYILILPI